MIWEVRCTLYGPVHVGFDVGPEAGHIAFARACEDISDVLVGNHLVSFSSDQLKIECKTGWDVFVLPERQPFLRYPDF